MPNLKDIRKRIGSVKNTQKITRAMKLVTVCMRSLPRRSRSMVASGPHESAACVSMLSATRLSAADMIAVIFPVMWVMMIWRLPTSR